MGSLPQLSILKGPQRQFTPRLLHKIFEEQVDNGTCADQTALIFHDKNSGERITTYKQLNEKSNSLAAALIHQVKHVNSNTANQDGDYIIAVCMMPSDNLVKVLLAIWKAGAAYLPLDPTFPPNRIEHILNESKPVLVIHDNQIENTNIFQTTPFISYDNLKSKSTTFSNANINTEFTLCGESNDLGLVLYTSGSTGIPKGVRLPHAIVLNRLQWQWEKFPYSKTERIGIFKTALTFVDSVTEIWGPLLNEMAVLVITKDVTKDPERLVECLESYKIERLVLVPTLLRSLLMYLSLKKQNDLLYNLKIWVCSGEPLPVSLANSFFDYFTEGVHKLCNFYGSTEIMGDVTYYECDSKKQLIEYSKVPIGYALNNTVIYLLDSDFRPVKLGQVGELYVSGLNLAAGYVNGRDPDRFIENPLGVDPKYARIYRTGDFASIEKGVLHYEGRTDSQIKIRGHRVDLLEVEKNLLTIDGVQKGIVLCYHAGLIDQALLAFITVDDKACNKSGLQIERILKNKLPEYMIPQVMIIESIPLLVNGKVDRQSLLKMYENTNNNDDTEVAVDYDYSGVLESQMAQAKDLFETVGNVIGRSTRATIKLSSNFYELGGNSLNSIYTVTLLREKNYFISITDFIGATCLNDILIKICVNNDYDKLSDMKTDDHAMKLHAVPLAVEHKKDTIEIITSSFFEKADLEQWLKPHILRSDYGDILDIIWEILIEKGLSFLVKDSNNRSVGVSLNFDARDEPEVQVNSKLIIVFEFLESIEGPIRDQYLPNGQNQILHSFMMGTGADLNAQENITVMQFMENEVLHLAKRRNFAGIFTTNTNPLTQQLGSDVYGYKTMLDFQVNQYTYHDDTKPFSAAPDAQRALVQWKEI